MAKLYIRGLIKGLNKHFPPHLIGDTECSELLNVNFRKGKWVKRQGFTYPFSQTADLLSVIEVFDFLKKDGTNYLLCATPDGIYSLSGTSWIGELDLLTTRSVTNKWFTTEIADSIYATNGVDNIYVASTLGGLGGNFSPITWDITTDPGGNVGIEITRANCILAFNSRLYFFNTTSSTDGNQPQRIYWTEVNDFDRVESQNFINLDYSHSPIISAGILGSGLIAVYKTDSVVTVQNTGDPVLTPRFRAMVGLIAPKAVTSHPSGHFFVGQTGFYLFSGGQVVPVGEDRVVSYFFDNLNYSAKENIYCFTDFTNREIYIFYPTGANTKPDSVLVYNWAYDNWCEWSFSGWCAFYHWRGQTSPSVYTGDDSGYVKKLGGTTDNGVAISTKIRTKAFFNFSDNQRQQPSDYVQVTRVVSDTTPSSASLVVGTSDTGGASPTETIGTLDTTSGKAPKADFSVFGRYVTIGANDFDEISEFVVDWSEAGDN